MMDDKKKVLKNQKLMYLETWVFKLCVQLSMNLVCEKVKFGDFEEITLHEQAAGTIRTESCSHKFVLRELETHGNCGAGTFIWMTLNQKFIWKMFAESVSHCVFYINANKELAFS